MGYAEMRLVIRSESVVTAQSLYGDAIREDVAFWKSSDPVPHVVTSGGETRTGAGVSGWKVLDKDGTPRLPIERNL